MKKAIIAILVCLAIAVPVASVAKPVTTQHIYLREKDPSDWSIIEDGAWGKLNVNCKKNTFVFNGHGLVAGEEYVLVNYYEDWPDAIEIGRAVVDCDGNIHIMGDLPDLEYVDYSHPDYDDQDYDYEGAKIWLVQSCDYTAGDPGSLAWSPSGWLFETSLLVP